MENYTNIQKDLDVNAIKTEEETIVVIKMFILKCMFLKKKSKTNTESISFLYHFYII